jgi:predicted secreted protein
MIDPGAIQHTPGGALTVQGTTATLQPYAVEVTDPARAAKWAALLAGRQYNRCCVGSKPFTGGGT